MSLIYSQWRPDNGGYDYLEAAGVQNLNDDLPTPELPAATKIGVPSIEAGRSMPSGAEYVGSGEVARGLVAPVDGAKIVRRTRSLAGIDMEDSESVALVAVAAFTVIGIAWYLRKKR